MTVSPVSDTMVDLRTDPTVAVAWARLREAQRRLEDAQKEVALYRDRFDEVIGGREHITSDGNDVAFYRHDGRFSAKRFTEDMPHIAASYTRERTESFLDEDALKRDHPYLYAQYRARTLRAARGARL